MLVANCPRCGATSITFDVKAQQFAKKQGWQHWFELFCVCRHCHQSTVFIVKQDQPNTEILFVKDNGLVEIDRSLNEFVTVARYVSLRDSIAERPPDHVPDSIGETFNEGATCLAVECWNASAAMFRLCVDLATKPLLPDGEVPGLNNKTRRDLGLRLPWLFENQFLPSGLRDLSACIREDGNDGAHAGNLTREDAEDLLDFTRALLERLYTEPERLRAAEKRRQERRAVEK